MSHESVIADSGDQLSLEPANIVRREPGLVSVIVPSFNYGHLIAGTLDSVINQSYTHWECIVVDDGSTDLTRDVVNGYVKVDSRIRYVYQENKGLSAARNRGLQASRGVYIQFLDSDDLIEPRKLELQAGYLDLHPQTGIVYSPVRYFRTDHPTERQFSMREPDVRWMPETSGAGMQMLRSLAKANIMIVNAPMIRLEAIKSVGGFNESLNSLEDWEYWIRCALEGTEFRYVDREGTYALARNHAQSMIKNQLAVLTAKVTLYEIAAALARDAVTQDLFRNQLPEAREALYLHQIEEGIVIKGALSLTRLYFSESRYRLAVKSIVCLVLVPAVGKDRFAWLLFDFSMFRIFQNRANPR